MGWLKRNIETKEPIEYRGSELPPIKPEEEGQVEIVAAEASLDLDTMQMSYQVLGE